MNLYTATVFDASGAIVWAKGYGDYVEADTAQEARDKAEAEFRQPFTAWDTLKDDERAFFERIEAKREACIRDGFRVEVRRK